MEWIDELAPCTRAHFDAFLHRKREPRFPCRQTEPTNWLVEFLKENRAEDEEDSQEPGHHKR